MSVLLGRPRINSWNQHASMPELVCLSILTTFCCAWCGGFATHARVANGSQLCAFHGAAQWPSLVGLADSSAGPRQAAGDASSSGRLPPAPRGGCYRAGSRGTGPRLCWRAQPSWQAAPSRTGRESGSAGWRSPWRSTTLGPPRRRGRPPAAPVGMGSTRRVGRRAGIPVELGQVELRQHLTHGTQADHGVIEAGAGQDAVPAAPVAWVHLVAVQRGRRGSSCTASHIDPGIAVPTHPPPTVAFIERMFP